MTERSKQVPSKAGMGCTAVEHGQYKRIEAGTPRMYEAHVKEEGERKSPRAGWPHELKI